MPPRRIENVRKRDGTVEPYDESKLAAAIHRAACAAGQDNRALAGDLAGVVTTYLERYHDRAVPTSAEIQSMVEKILLETGHADIARAYMRETAPPPPPAARPQGDLFPTPVLVDAATRDEVSAWGRDRITAALVKEAGLEEDLAREIAGAVEERVFREGNRRVSTSMIRELVNQELLARGLGARLRRQLVVGLPKYDLDRLVKPDEGAPDPDRLCRTIGETTLRQYVLQEVYPRDVADAHVEGRLHLHHVEHPTKQWWLAPSVEAVRRNGVRAPLLGDAPRDGRSLTAHLEAMVRETAPHVAEAVELAHVNAHYALVAGDPGEEAAGLLRSVRARFAVDLGLPAYLRGAFGEHEARANAFASELMKAAREVPGELAFFVGDASFGEPLRDACRFAAAHGRSLFVFERGATPSPRLSRWTTGDGAWCGAHAVTLNLPQAFYRGETASDFYAELERAFDLAVQAHLQKRQLLRRSGRAQDGELLVGLAGLPETARLMTGADPGADESALRLALRIVSYLYFRAREEAGRHGLRFALHDVADAEVAARFARVDRQLFPRARSLEGAYTPGCRLGPRSLLRPDDAVAAESRFHTLVPSGAATIPRAQRESMSPGDLYGLLERAYRSTLAAQVRLE